MPPSRRKGREGGDARDCGDFDAHCESGYTFFRRDTQVRSTADQADAAHEWVYIVYDPSKPGSQVPTGTTYGSIDTGIGSQSATYFLRYDGATGTKTTPVLIDDQADRPPAVPGHRRSRMATLHAIWWDSRNDPSYSRTRPVGNDAAGHTVASLDVYGATSTTSGASWTGKARISNTTTQSELRAVRRPDRCRSPATTCGSSASGGRTFATWTDWRDTVQGADPREVTEDEDDGSADVKQCRTFTAAGGWSGDTCPHDGGLDQNIYGAPAP